MIKFIPITYHLTNPLSDPEKFVNNRGSESLAAQLEDRIGNEFCELHPNYINEVEVDMSKPPDKWLSIRSSCCSDFERNLEMVCNNQNPFLKG